MNRIIAPVLIALLLIAGGAVLLVYNLGWLGNWGPWIWTAGFAVAGLVFIAVFVADRRQWWALIPGGILLVQAIIPVLALVLPGQVIGALFFVGIGLVFGVLYLLRGPGRPLGWAIWAALGCCAFGLFVLAVSYIQQLGILIGPLFLIALGLFLIAQPFLRRRR